MAYLQLNYHVNEIRFGEKILKFENEDWTIGNVKNMYGHETFLIKSPKGALKPSNFMIVNNGTHAGIQFETNSYFPLGEYGYPEKLVNINTVAIVRQPYNVWIWAYLMDEKGNNVATFCGYDDLDDGLEKFVEDLKEKYGL